MHKYHLPLLAKRSLSVLDSFHPIKRKKQSSINSNIRTHHECEDGIDQYISRITVWHHEACRVTTNGDHVHWRSAHYAVYARA